VEPSKEWNQLNCCQRIHLSTIMWNMQGKDMVVCREICLPINILRFKEVERIIRCYSLIFSAYQMPKKNKVFCVTNAYCMCQTTRTNAKSISTRAKKRCVSQCLQCRNERNYHLRGVLAIYLLLYYIQSATFFLFCEPTILSIIHLTGHFIFTQEA